MFNFFDYCYYCICKFYDRSGEGSASGISALALLTVMQITNLITVFALFFQLSHIYLNINKFFYAIPYFILLVLNGFRYNKLNYEVLKDKWKGENVEVRQRKLKGVMLYMVFSIITVIAVIIWRASTK